MHSNVKVQPVSSIYFWLKKNGGLWHWAPSIKYQFFTEFFIYAVHGELPSSFWKMKTFSRRAQAVAVRRVSSIVVFCINLPLGIFFISGIYKQSTLQASVRNSFLSIIRGGYPARCKLLRLKNLFCYVSPGPRITK